jgi:hypothetical protein
MLRYVSKTTTACHKISRLNAACRSVKHHRGRFKVARGSARHRINPLNVARHVASHRTNPVRGGARIRTPLRQPLSGGVRHHPGSHQPIECPARIRGLLSHYCSMSLQCRRRSINHHTKPCKARTRIRAPRHGESCGGARIREPPDQPPLGDIQTCMHCASYYRRMACAFANCWAAAPTRLANTSVETQRDTNLSGICEPSHQGIYIHFEVREPIHELT